MDLQVSVLMAVHNCERYLTEAIESILSQSLREFELVVVDDGSTDRSSVMLEELRCRDPRMQVFRNQTNRGLARSLNCGLRHCKGRLIARADGDDVYPPSRLEAQVHYLGEHPETGVLSGAIRYIDERGNPVGSDLLPVGDEEIKFWLNLRVPIVHSGVMFRRNLLEQIGGYDESFNHGPEDYDLFARLRYHTRFANLSETVVLVRLHERSVRGAGADRIYSQAGVVCQRLLSEYLSREVVFGEASLMFKLFLNSYLLSPDEVRSARRVCAEIYATARGRENRATVVAFRRDLGNVLLQQAIYQTRTSNATSLRLLCTAARYWPPLLKSNKTWRQLHSLARTQAAGLRDGFRTKSESRKPRSEGGA